MTSVDMLTTYAKTRKNFACRLSSSLHAIGKAAFYTLLVLLVSCTVLLVHIFDEGRAFSDNITSQAYDEGYELYSVEINGQSYPVFSEPISSSDELPITGNSTESEPENLLAIDDDFNGACELVFGIVSLPLYKDFQNIDIDGLPVVVASQDPVYTTDEYRNGLSCIPSHILRRLGEKGWTVHLTDQRLEDLFPFISVTKDVEDVAGVCLIFQREIWITSEMSPYGLIHEIGHAVDWELGGASISSEWNDAISEVNRVIEKNDWDTELYEEISFSNMEKYQLCRGIVSRKPCFEQYANAWTKYWTEPDSMLVECPEMFEYFASQFGIYRLGKVRESDARIEKTSELSPQFAVQESIDALLDKSAQLSANPISEIAINDRMFEKEENRAAQDVHSIVADAVKIIKIK